MLEPSHSPTTIALKPQKERGAPLEVLFHFLLWTHERTRWVELQSLQRNNGFVWRIFHTNYVLSIRLFILQSRFISFCDVGSLAPISLRELIRGLIQLYLIIPSPSRSLRDGWVWIVLPLCLDGMKWEVWWASNEFVQVVDQSLSEGYNGSTSDRPLEFPSFTPI